MHRLIPISDKGKLGPFLPLMDTSQERKLLRRWLSGDWYAWEWLVRSNIPVNRRAWYIVDGMRRTSEQKGKEEGPHCLNPWKVFQRFKKNCGKEMLPNVVALLSDPNPEVNVHASGLLGEIHGVTLDIACAAPALATLLDHDNNRVREFAASRLGTISGKRFGYDAEAAREWWRAEGSKNSWPEPLRPTTREEILAEVGIASPPDEQD